MSSRNPCFAPLSEPFPVGIAPAFLASPPLKTAPIVSTCNLIQKVLQSPGEETTKVWFLSPMRQPAFSFSFECWSEPSSGWGLEVSLWTRLCARLALLLRCSRTISGMYCDHSVENRKIADVDRLLDFLSAPLYFCRNQSIQKRLCIVIASSCCSNALNRGHRISRTKEFDWCLCAKEAFQAL